MVLIRVQHAEGRTAPLERLLGLLPPTVEVVTDSGDPPNPWRGYKKALSDLPETGHVCVLQDDTLPCRNFAEAIERIADANPVSPVCLFVGGLPRRTSILLRKAQGQGKPYADVHRFDFMPVVAVLWPVETARAMLAWVEGNPLRIGHPDPRSDDAVCGRWMRFTATKVRATVPSIVQHDDVFPSTIGKKASAGRNAARVAFDWIGDADPLGIKW